MDDLQISSTLPDAGPLARDQRAPLPDTINLVVVFGGQSAEREVSRITAAHVIRALDARRYRVSAMAIDRSGRWLDATAAAAAIAAAPTPVGDQSPLAVDLVGADTTVLPATSADPGAPTVVLPLLHGPNGEDGTLQGFLELCNVAYVGSGVLGSAVAMDKAVAKELCDANSIPQARWAWAHERDLTDSRRRSIIDDLGFPMFVKPANLGSSIGISKASDESELIDAIAVALEHDESVVFEENIVGREIEVAVLGNEDLRVSVPGEIVPGADFYDYEDKYFNGTADLRIPAELPADAAAELPDLARRCFRTLRCADLGRVDFFYTEDRGWLLNEINTMPGFTPISMYPQLWAASGLAYSALIDELVRLALDRHAHRGNRRR